jgi:CHRD domain
MKRLWLGTLLASLLALLALLPTASPAQASGGATLRTALSAANETPPNNTGGTGFATVTLNPGHQTVCFTITVSQNVLPATAAHIHVAPVGQPGPIVVPLTPPGPNGASSGCVHATRALILNIIRQPSTYYVNVHNAQFPAGVVRGQLTR